MALVPSSNSSSSSSNAKQGAGEEVTQATSVTTRLVKKVKNCNNFNSECNCFSFDRDELGDDDLQDDDGSSCYQVSETFKHNKSQPDYFDVLYFE
jgi:hypothetical protein